MKFEFKLTGATYFVKGDLSCSSKNDISLVKM